jgi:hypothetical protein
MMPAIDNEVIWCVRCGRLKVERDRALKLARASTFIAAGLAIISIAWLIGWFLR